MWLEVLHAIHQNSLFLKLISKNTLMKWKDVFLETWNRILKAFFCGAQRVSVNFPRIGFYSSTNQGFHGENKAPFNIPNSHIKLHYWVEALRFAKNVVLIFIFYLNIRLTLENVWDIDCSKSRETRASFRYFYNFQGLCSFGEKRNFVKLVLKF